MTAIRTALGAVTGLCLGLLAGCNGPDVSEKPLEAASTIPSAEASSSEAADTAASSAAALDFAALQEHEDPERLLRFYVEAVRAGDWGDAAKAWSLDAQVSPTTLRQGYGDGAPPNLVFGQGDTDEAAGTLFYQAPIIVTFPDKSQPDRRGNIVLRRVNDAPGASEEQLNWRIERSTVLEPSSQ